MADVETTSDIILVKFTKCLLITIEEVCVTTMPFQ